MQKNSSNQQNARGRRLRKAMLPATALILAMSVLTACEATDGTEEATPLATTETTSSTDADETTEEAPAEETPAEETPAEEAPAPPVEEAPAEPEMSVQQKNAVRAADNYISIMPFSSSSLATQLEFEGYTTDEANYAISQLDVDWAEQAVKAAENYIDIMPFSAESLTTQLEFDGHSPEHAAAAVASVGL